MNNISFQYSIIAYLLWLILKRMGLQYDATIMHSVGTKHVLDLKQPYLGKIIWTFWQFLQNTISSFIFLFTVVLRFYKLLFQGIMWMYFEVCAIHWKSIDRNFLGLYIYPNSNWRNNKKYHHMAIYFYLCQLQCNPLLSNIVLNHQSIIQLHVFWYTLMFSAQMLATKRTLILFGLYHKPKLVRTWYCIDNSTDDYTVQWLTQKWCHTFMW